MNVFDEDEPGRALWLVTLADLSLLLVGFFVLLQATRIEPGRLAAGIRAGFNAASAPAPAATPVPPAAMPVQAAVVTGFAPASATPSDIAAAIAWARVAAADPRTRLRITGEVDGTPRDVDPATGSGAVLAADRARAVAAALVRARAVAPARIAITTATGQRRTLLTLGFEGAAP